VAILGLTGGKPSAIDVDRLTLDEIDLMGIRSSPNAYPAMIALMQSGRLDLSPLVTHVYPLERVGEALAVLESRQAVRPIVEI
ncbi:MAG TPA: hypothetical protein VLA54_11730, partial [Acidimicrobiia bacterium]|nr:hypothetical protein [Acidimicrobiia bacterium]